MPFMMMVRVFDEWNGAFGVQYDEEEEVRQTFVCPAFPESNVQIESVHERERANIYVNNVISDVAQFSLLFSLV